MATQAQRNASARYDRENTRQFALKLNVRTDADILDWLDAQPNVQGAIKRLLREETLRAREDGEWADRIEAACKDGDATAAWTEAYPATLFVRTDDAAIGGWLARRFGARFEDTLGMGECWTVECGDGQSHDRVLMPLVDRWCDATDSRGA